MCNRQHEWATKDAVQILFLIILIYLFIVHRITGIRLYCLSTFCDTVYLLRVRQKVTMLCILNGWY